MIRLSQCISSSHLSKLVSESSTVIMQWNPWWYWCKLWLFSFQCKLEKSVIFSYNRRFFNTEYSRAWYIDTDNAATVERNSFSVKFSIVKISLCFTNTMLSLTINFYFLYQNALKLPDCSGKKTVYLKGILGHLMAIESNTRLLLMN